MASEISAKPKTWGKVLYKKQNVPDNYVDATFLSDLRKNVNLYHYTWWEAFTGVAVVTHEVTCSVLFVVTFIYLKSDTFSITTVLTSVTLLLIACSLIQQLVARDWWMLDKTEYAKSYIIFFGYMFSPILKTLTQSISTDTIHAMVALMLVAHVLFQDYGADAAMVSPTLSLNSALFAAVCLASRLPSVLHTFALVVLAVEIFVLVPLLRKKLRYTVPGLLAITAVFFLIVFTALVQISTAYALMFAGLCFCINVLCPTLFVYSQKYKENIFGPWDEAIVKT